LEVALPRGALLRDRAAIEELVDDLRDFGFGVEPFDEFVSWVAVADAIVEFVPDFCGEICDVAAPAAMPIALCGPRECAFARCIAVSCFHIFYVFGGVW
jgi:hypothetical protein